MFKKLATECANNFTGRCEGAIFEFVFGELHHRIAPDIRGKKCLVEQGKTCDWFTKCVLPGIMDTSQNQAVKEKYCDLDIRESKSHNQNTSAGRYIRICKNCGKKFYASSPNTMYCKNCRAIRDQKNRRKYKRKKNYRRKSILVSD